MRKITIMDEDNHNEHCYVGDSDELQLGECLTDRQMEMFNQNSDQIFYHYNSEKYKEDTDEEGYETGKIITLESPLEDVFAGVDDAWAILLLGKKIKVNVNYGGIPYKILATSATEVGDVLEIIVGNISKTKFFNVDIDSKLKELEKDSKVYLEYPNPTS